MSLFAVHNYALIRPSRIGHYGITRCPCGRSGHCHSAFVRVQRLAEQWRASPLDKVMDRLSALEQRVAASEKKLPPTQPGALPPPESTAAPTARVTLAPPSVTTPSSQTAPPSPGQLEETPRPREVAPAHFANPFAAPPPYASQAKSTSSLDWETIIGGRWLY